MYHSILLQPWDYLRKMILIKINVATGKDNTRHELCTLKKKIGVAALLSENSIITAIIMMVIIIIIVIITIIIIITLH